VVALGERLRLRPQVVLDRRDRRLLLELREHADRERGESITAVLEALIEHVELVG
jgi:hypothetical protein